MKNKIPMNISIQTDQNIGNGMETPPVTPQQPLQTTTNVAPPTPAEMAKPAQ